MKKSIKLQFLTIGLLLALFQQDQYASTDKNNKIISVFNGNGPVGVASRLTLPIAAMFAIHIYDEYQNDKPFIKDEYHHAQEWYTTYLKNKYPHAHFETKSLRHHNDNDGEADYNSIYLNTNDVSELNDIYKKRKYGEKLSDADIAKISEIEYILLHEAGHIEHRDKIHQNILALGFIGMVDGLESLHAHYKNKRTITPTIIPTVIPMTWSQAAWKATKTIPKGAAKITGMITAYYLAAMYHSRYVEGRADDFANQHADINVLKAGSLYFSNKIKQSTEIDTTPVGPNTTVITIPIPYSVQAVFHSHPSPESRIKKIENEIKRREKIN